MDKKGKKYPKIIIIGYLIYKIFGILNNELYFKNKILIEGYLD